MSHSPLRARSRLWTVGWLVLLAGWLGNAASQQFSFRQYAQNDGLTNLAAGYLVTDSTGDLWAGTDGGLFRSDGSAFVSYDPALGLPSETIRGLALVFWKRLWVSLDRGLYVGGARGFEPVHTQSGLVLTDHSLPIAFLAKDHILVAYKAHVQELWREQPDSGPWRAAPLFSAEQLKATPELDKVVSFYTASDGTLWLGCGKQLCTRSADKLRTSGAAGGGAPGRRAGGAAGGPRGGGRAGRTARGGGATAGAAGGGGAGAGGD